jgi:hypothetical protein
MIVTSVRLRHVSWVGLLMAIVLVSGCGSGGGADPGAGVTLDSGLLDLTDQADTSAIEGAGTAATETDPAQLVDACNATLAGFTELGTPGANAAAVTMVGTICTTAAEQNQLPLSDDPDAAAAAFADMLRAQPDALRPVCLALATDAIPTLTGTQAPRRYLKVNDRKGFVDTTCRLLPDYTSATGFDLTSLFADHKQLGAPFCTALVLRIYDTRWSERRKAQTPRELYWLVARRSCGAATKNGSVVVSAPTQIEFTDRAAFSRLFENLYLQATR